MKAFIFKNIQIGASSEIILISSTQHLKINNFTLNQVSSTDPFDIETVALKVTSVDMSSPENIEISNVDFTNSSITLVSFLSFVNSPPSLQSLTFTDMAFYDCLFSSQRSILKTDGIEHDLNIVISYNNVSFTNIFFATTGFLFELDHQLPTNLTISNSSFKNVKQGNIKITSSNLQNTALLTSVHMLNVTVDNVQQDSQSFINVEEGGRLFISGSQFSNMYIYSDGGVISGGPKGTIITITNSLFQNNSAQNGGVFDAKEESVIKCYYCNITQNFGITSGVVNVAQNGYFEFYDSNIYNNYANSNPVSQLFDSAPISIISNCKIYQNQALTKSQINTEFNTICSLL